MLVVPGNHDIEWWKSPLGLLGERRKYAKYSRYFRDLTPVLEIPGAIIAGALSSYGVALGSLTWNIRRRRGEGTPARLGDRPGHGDLRQGAARSGAGPRRSITTCCRGELSRRMGLANWRSAHRRLLATGADVILCGHDHQEGAGQIEGAWP